MPRSTLSPMRRLMKLFQELTPEQQTAAIDVLDAIKTPVTKTGPGLPSVPVPVPAPVKPKRRPHRKVKPAPAPDIAVDAAVDTE